MARTSIGVGIVGYGRAGRLFHAQLIAREPRLKLCAVATRNLDRQKQARLDYPGIRVYSTVDELLGDDDVRLVVIATPHDTHAQMAIRAANEGRHVVVDKVMCLSVSEADQMISAAKAAGVLLSVFHNRRWDGDFLTIRRALAAGLLGRLRLAEIGIWGYSPSRGWRAQRQHMGGLLFDWGAHLVDQAIILFGGPPHSISAWSQFDRPETDVETFARCEMRFPDGALACVEVSKTARLGKPHWFLVGDKGALMKHGVDPQEAALLEGRLDHAIEDSANRARVTAEVNGTAAQMVLDTVRGDWTAFYTNIADALLEGAELEVKPEEIRRVVAVLEGSLRSAFENRVLTIQADGTYA